MAWGIGQAVPKPEKRSTTKNRARRQHRERTAEIRAYVFGRERGICRCCRIARADSMHELRPRSLGGKVSKQNSIAVCGSGTTLCHGYLQRLEIEFKFREHGSGAERAIEFRPRTQKAADQMRVALHQWVLSEPMGVYEVET